MAESSSEEQFCGSVIEEDGYTHECSLETGHEYAHKCFCGEEW
jgi:hypothetical protein